MTRYLKDSPELLEKLAHVDIVYTDLDGTLLGHGGTLLIDGEGNPSINTAQAVVDANKAGLKIVPVTGRSCAQLTEITRMCGWTDYIAEAGAIRSYFDGKDRTFIFDVPEWNTATKRKLTRMTPLEVIREHEVVEKLMDAFPGCIEYHTPWDVYRDASEVLRGFLNRQAALEILDEIELPLALIDNGVINPRKHTLKESDEPIRAYHLAPAGVSKRRAIALDLEYRGIDPARAVMIGDAPSDMMCAEVVSLSVLMENALRSPGIDKRIDNIANTAVVEGIAGDGWTRTINAILKHYK